jgi:hypothetical protein
MAIDSETVIGQLKILNGATSKVEQNTNPIPLPSVTVPVQRTVGFLYSHVLSPQAGAVVFSYSIPPRCKAHLEFIELQLIRETVASPVDEAALTLDIGYAGPSVFLFDNAVGAHAEFATSCDIWLYGPNRPETGFDPLGDNVIAKQALTLAYYDNSTGGTIRANAYARVLEYSQ